MHDDPSRTRTYFGPERRNGQDRRKQADRREEFRFDLSKEQRRTGKDRRKQNGWDGTLIR